MRHIYWIPGGLLLLSWLSPLHVMPWLSWHNEVLAAFAVMAGCAGALFAARRLPAAGQVLVPTLALLPLLVLAVALLQFLAGRIYFTGSLLVIAAYALLAAAAATAGHAAAARGSTRALDALAGVMLAAALLQWLVAGSQVFALWSGADWVTRISYLTRAGGNLAQPNHAAALFLLGLCGAAWLRSTAQAGKAVTALVFVLLASGLAMTQSRSGLLALGALTLGVLLRREALGGRRTALAALGYLALVLLLYRAWPEFATWYWKQPADAVNYTTSGRLEMWAQLLQALQMRPWFGWGVMQVAQAQNAVADRFDLVLTASYSHNVLLDIALWAGLPALGLLLWAVAAWLLPRLRQARSAQACFCIAPALVLLVQSMFEFPYAYLYFLVPAFFALGALDAVVGRGAGLRLPRGAAAALLAVFTGMYAWAAVEYVAIEEDFRVARFEALRVGATPVQYEPPKVVLLTQLGAMLHATRLQPRPGMPAAELAQLEAVALFYPWGNTSFRHLTALALNGRMDEARRQLQALRALHGAKTHEAILQSLDELAQQHPVLRQLLAP